MQISGANASAGALYRSNVAKGEPLQAEDFANLANYADKSNTIFQNLLKNPDVADNISTDADGNYVFTFNQTTPASNEEQMARWLIIEQTSEKIVPEGVQTPYSVAELARFRQLTGYNLMQVSSTADSLGAYTVVDDYGRSPTGPDADYAKAMWDAFDSAKGFQDLYGEKGADLTKQNLLDAMSSMKDVAGADTVMFDAMIDLVEASWADEMPLDG
jgi:hypothetical protein